MRRPLHLVAVAALLSAGCFSEKPAPAEPIAKTASVEAASQGTVFSPATVTIEQGGSVTWTFGTFTHNVTFLATPGAPTNVPTTRNGTATRTFAAPGTFAYACTIHPGMIGSVIVK